MSGELQIRNDWPGGGGSGPSSLMGKRAALPPADPNCCGGGFGILGRRSAG